MRVLFISRRYFPAISGMSVYALNLLRELVRREVDVTLIAQYRGDPQGQKVYGGGPPIPLPGVVVLGAESVGETTGGDFERDIDAVVELALREHSIRPFDLIHAQYGYPPGLAALELSKRLGIPNLVSIQGGDGHWVGTCCAYHRQAMQAVLGHSGAVLIGSASFAREVQAHNGTPLERFTLIPGAVDTQRFVPRQNLQVGALKHDGRPHFLFHGRVDARKGALDLVDAFAGLLGQTASSPRLTISGIGPDSERVAARVKQLNLSDHVRLTGYVAYEDVPAVYGDADIFVSPTYAEGFSNTILEAMASGVPVVSTQVVGVTDCLRHGENGLLVPAQDIPSLTAAMLRLLEDSALRRELASAALVEVVEKYSWLEVGTRILKTYHSLVGTTPDNQWQLPPPENHCRYRREPHLL